MKNIFLLLVILFALPAVAQQKSNVAKTDSILALLPQLRGAEKLDALHTLVYINDYDHSLKHFAEMLRQEAQRQNDIEMEGYAWTRLIFYYYSQYDSDSIFTVAEEAVQFLRRHNLYAPLEYVQRAVIFRHAFAGRHLTALRKADELYAEIKETGDEWLLIEMLYNIATVYSTMDKNEEALRIFDECLEIALRNRQDDIIYVRLYCGMAITALDLKRYDETLRHADSLHVETRRLLEWSPQAYVQEFIFVEEYFRARAYTGLRQTGKAFEAMQRAKALFDPLLAETQVFSMTIEEMYYYYYHATGDYDKAMAYLRILNQYMEETLQMESYVLKGNVYMAQLLFDMGNYRQAAELFSHVLSRRDTLNTQQFYAQLNELRTIYELDRSHLENERQRAKIRQQQLVNTGLAGACVAALIIAALVAWNRKRLAEKNKGLNSQIKEQDRLEEELKKVRAKILKLQRILKNPIPVDLTEKEIDSCETEFEIEIETDVQEDEIFERLSVMMNEQRFFAVTDIKRKDLADKMGINEKVLSNCIKKYTGMGFNEYINHIRLNHAREMLLSHENHKIETVAINSGFARGTFYRIFKEKYKMTPDEYRNENK